jgi:predicted type IV restriction endonuclease
VQEKLLEFVERMQTEKRFETLDEAAIKQAVVLRILSFLNWDPFNIDEVMPEHPVNGGKVDFALRDQESNKAFIAVSKDAGVFEDFEEQLSIWAHEQKAQIFVITNGITWWFCLPLREETLEDRRFHILKMKEQNAETITQRLFDFLSKAAITSGKALAAAERIHHSRKKEALIKEHLPRAWKKVLNEPERWLRDAVIEVTKELCGQEPDLDTVKTFIASEAGAGLSVRSYAESSSGPASQKASRPRDKEAQAGKSIVSFSLQGLRIEVHSWKDMFVQLCEMVFKDRNEADDLEVALTMSEFNRDFFTRNPHQFLESEMVKGTDLYVDTGLSPKEFAVVARELISLFGYEKNDLTFEVKR